MPKPSIPDHPTPAATRSSGRRRQPLSILALGLVLTAAMATASACGEHPAGFTDTPPLPGSKWRVHDDERPRPEAVDPGPDRASPPADAVVLFDGTDASAWRDSDGNEVPWKVEDGELIVVPGSGDIFTREEFGDIQLPLEFATHDPPESNSQRRSNGGVFLMGSKVRNHR